MYLEGEETKNRLEKFRGEEYAEICRLGKKNQNWLEAVGW